MREPAMELLRRTVDLANRHEDYSRMFHVGCMDERLNLLYATGYTSRNGGAHFADARRSIDAFLALCVERKTSGLVIWMGHSDCFAHKLELRRLGRSEDGLYDYSREKLRENVRELLRWGAIRTAIQEERIALALGWVHVPRIERAFDGALTNELLEEAGLPIPSVF